MDVNLISSGAGSTFTFELWSRLGPAVEGYRVAKVTWTPAAPIWNQFLLHFAGVLTPLWEVRARCSAEGAKVMVTATVDRVAGEGLMLGAGVVEAP